MNAVVLGSSNIIGKPMAALLLAERATVTVAHIHTQDGAVSLTLTRLH
jgi:methylenetetrahydrofolate dehydrogenase (NADP+)/methenyltetrahydrofolate cyclohydrolase